MWDGYSDQIVFNKDGTLAFVATDEAQIYVVDMITNDIVHTIKIPNVSDLSGLLVHGDWLYITERGYQSQSSRLLRLDINPYSTGFLKEPKTIDFGVSSNKGFYDMTINNGTFLAITSPNTPRTFQRAYGGEIGDVYFLDITKIDEYGFLNPKYVATLDASKLN